MREGRISLLIVIVQLLVSFQPISRWSSSQDGTTCPAVLYSDWIIHHPSFGDTHLDCSRATVRQGVGFRVGAARGNVPSGSRSGRHVGGRLDHHEALRNAPSAGNKKLKRVRVASPRKRSDDRSLGELMH